MSKRRPRRHSYRDEQHFEQRVAQLGVEISDHKLGFATPERSNAKARLAFAFPHTDDQGGQRDRRDRDGVMIQTYRRRDRVPMPSSDQHIYTWAYRFAQRQRQDGRVIPRDPQTVADWMFGAFVRTYHLRKRRVEEYRQEYMRGFVAGLCGPVDHSLTPARIAPQDDKALPQEMIKECVACGHTGALSWQNQWVCADELACMQRRGLPTQAPKGGFVSVPLLKIEVDQSEVFAPQIEDLQTRASWVRAVIKRQVTVAEYEAWLDQQ